MESFHKFENIVEFVTFILNSTIFLGPTYFLWNRFRKHSSDFFCSTTYEMYERAESKINISVIER